MSSPGVCYANYDTIEEYSEAMRFIGLFSIPFDFSPSYAQCTILTLGHIVGTITYPYSAEQLFKVVIYDVLTVAYHFVQTDVRHVIEKM